MQAIIWQDTRWPQALNLFKKRKKTHTEFTYKAQVRWHSCTTISTDEVPWGSWGSVGADIPRWAQGLKSHLGLSMCGQACHSVFLCVCSFSTEMLKQSLSGLWHLLSHLGGYLMPVSFPAPFLEMKMSPTPRESQSWKYRISPSPALEGEFISPVPQITRMRSWPDLPEHGHGTHLGPFLCGKGTRLWAGRRHHHGPAWSAHLSPPSTHLPHRS